MSAGLQRATIFAVKEESAAGTYVPPSAGADFVPLRPGNSLNYEPEILESDELLNDIGASKGLIGKDVVSGSHSAYLRHSGVEGQEPQLGVMWESIMGSKDVNSVEYDTTSGSTVNKLVMPSAEGANFQAGQALLIKDASNGYSIRNVSSVSGDELNLNFRLSGAPASGTNTGKAVTYQPAAQGHPTFSTTKYLGNGHAIEVSAGNTVTEASITADANGYGEVEFSYEGTKYYFNPITITASTKFIDFTDDQGTQVCSVAEGIYKTPISLADAIKAALEGASSETMDCVYSSVDGKFIISSGSTLFSLLWNTGANASNSIGPKIGFSVAANDTGSVSYTSDNAITLTSAITPSYDSADAIVIKGAELFIGSAADNACICAQSVSITISKEVEDVDCICEESGVSEKIPTSRTVEMSVTATLNKYDAALLDALLKNSGISAMLNAGPKVGGNWVPGKCFNAYFPNATVSGYTTSGDSFIQAEITLKGFVTSTGKDVFINFI
jgi:hypothetical protein